MKLFSTIIVLSFVFILTACAACTDPDIPGTLPPTALSGEVYSESQKSRKQSGMAGAPSQNRHRG